MFECSLHCLLCNLVESHPPDFLLFFGRGPKLKSKVVSDGFAFAIRVRREEHLVGLGGSLLQLRNDFLFAWRDNQRRLECALRELNPDFIFGQVHDVADGRQHFIALAKIFFDRLRLGGRLDDHQ